MKRWILALTVAMMVLGLAACAAVPGADYDFTCDMKDYDSFAQIFQEKSLEEWESMGS